MRFSARQRIHVETNLARDRAETLLSELLDACRAVQIHNVAKTCPEMQCVDSLDRAISSTKQMVGMLDDALDQSAADLENDDLQLLDEIVNDPSVQLTDDDLEERFMDQSTEALDTALDQMLDRVQHSELRKQIEQANKRGSSILDIPSLPSQQQQQQLPDGASGLD